MGDICLIRETKRCLSYRISFSGEKTKIFMNMHMSLNTLGLEYKHNEKISSEKFLLSIVQVYYSKNAENSTILLSIIVL